MQCTDLEDLVDAWLDGELDLVRALEVERHLAACARCTETAARRRALRAMLAASRLRFAAAPALADRIRSAVGAEAERGDSLVFAARGATVERGARELRPAHVERPTHAQHSTPAARPRAPIAARPWRRAGAGVALVAAVIVGGAMLFPKDAPHDRVVDEMLASHVRSLMVDHLTDVASADQHTVRPWFDGKLDFSPAVKDLAAAGFPLLGGRLDYVGGRAVAALVYGRQKHAINLFVWPARPGEEVAAAPLVRHGYNFIGWTTEGTTHWAVSDLNPRELAQFVTLLREEVGESSRLPAAPPS